MNVRKVSETATSITIGWDPVRDAEGYRFYSAGVLRSRTFDTKRRTVRFSKGQEPYVVEAVVLRGIDSGSYPAAPPPPPPAKRYAPMTHHVGRDDQDPCYCMSPQYGAVWDSGRGLFVDQMGATYDAKGRLNEGRDRNRKPSMLKGAESMDGLEPCDQYVGPTGMTIGGSAGYPPESFDR